MAIVSGPTPFGTGVSAHVTGSTVVIYDDMIRTGGSLINAAKAYRDAGARRIFAITTHGIFPGDALERIDRSGLFEKIITTDSHPRAIELKSRRLEVRSVAGLLAQQLV